MFLKSQISLKPLIATEPLFLTIAVTNRNFPRRNQFHSFSITIESDVFPIAIDVEEQLQRRVEALTSHFIDSAQRYSKMLEKLTGIDIPDAKPTVDFSTNDLAKLVTTLSVLCPTDKIIDLKKAMMRNIFRVV